MKTILISILLILSSTVWAFENINEQQMYLQQTVNQCNYQLTQLQQQIAMAQQRGDAQAYNYLVWQYNGLKAQCDQEVMKIQRGYYNQ